MLAEEFEHYLTQCASRIEATLDDLLSDQPCDGETTRPARLLEAMRYACLGGGKRLRPFLLIETAKLFGVEGAGIVRAACALECVHCYSLIHDDLPAMDDDDLRRGKPTVHKVYDDATAILAGDALLTMAFDIMSAPEVHSDADVRIELVRGLAVAAGLGGMAGGQMLDLQAESAGRPLSADAIHQLQAMKTGALIRFACEAGAIVGQASNEQRKALTLFGARLGFLFQVTDDILDAESDAATLGKATGKDASRNKATLVAARGIEEAKIFRDQQVELAATQLEFFGGNEDVLRAALQFACSRNY